MVLGKHSHQLNYPISLLFDRQGNLYVVDCWNNRVEKFEIDSE
jgi:sugar lactone lactonase YvrE